MADLTWLHFDINTMPEMVSLFAYIFVSSLCVVLAVTICWLAQQLQKRREQIAELERELAFRQLALELRDRTLKRFVRIVESPRKRRSNGSQGAT